MGKRYSNSKISIKRLQSIRLTAVLHHVDCPSAIRGAEITYQLTNPKNIGWTQTDECRTADRRRPVERTPWRYPFTRQSKLNQVWMKIQHLFQLLFSNRGYNVEKQRRRLNGEWRLPNSRQKAKASAEWRLKNAEQPTKRKIVDWTKNEASRTADEV